MSLLFALVILQVGPNSAAGNEPIIPPEVYEQRALNQAAERAADSAAGIELIRDCQTKAASNAVAAEGVARGWLDVAQGQERVLAQHCLGLALANQLRWAESASAFETARGLVPAAQQSYRAQLAALAGNTRLAAGDPVRALTLLDAGADDAAAAGQTALLGQIGADRASALVALGRTDEAGAALDAARAAAPDNALVWLLSATLARRQGDLVQAQAAIERAAQLAPDDVRTGLEAGVIAALDGRDDSARRSFQSVIALDPGGSEAAAAKEYLAQLGGNAP